MTIVDYYYFINDKLNLIFLRERKETTVLLRLLYSRKIENLLL